MSDRFGHAATSQGSAGLGALTPSTVMTTNLEKYEVTTNLAGDIIETTIFFDLTGVSSTTTDNDIIGAAGICHIGRITNEVNGYIFAGQVECAEVPAGGVTDINLSASSSAEGAYDADATALANTQAMMTGGGAMAVGTVKPVIVLPTNDYYMYLSSGAAGTAAAYTAGKLVIKLWGKVTAL